MPSTPILKAQGGVAGGERLHLWVRPGEFRAQPRLGDDHVVGGVGELRRRVEQRLAGGERGAGPVGQVEDQGDAVQRHDLPPVPSWWLRSLSAIPCRVRAHDTLDIL
jgi:hypothetical protein